jgi:hypothetical protein
MYRYLIILISLLVLSGCNTTRSSAPDLEKAENTSPAQLEKETMTKDSCSTPECDDNETANSTADEEEIAQQPEDTLGNRSKPWEPEYPKKPWEPDFPKKPWEPDFPHQPEEPPIPE